MPYIEVRPARPEDRETVLAFCEQTWEWGDYIDEVWDKWLTNTNGLLLVATADDKPAGVAHIDMVTRTDAWLEGLRVDPAFRQQGLARALNEQLLIEAMQRGATYARLAVESENRRSRQIVEQNHWRHVSSFTLFVAPGLAASSEHRPPLVRPRPATADDLDTIIDFLNVSNIFPLVGGLYNVSWRAFPITSTLLEEKIAAQQIYVLYQWNRLDGLAIVELREGYRGKRLSIGYIDGTAIEPISLIAHDLRLRAFEMELDGVLAFVPDTIMLRDAFTGVGYQWDPTIYYIYERSLT
jgi:GNAT superfamily N-acetyltransferase